MKLADTTIDVLKNFSSINKSLYVREGNVLRTMSTSKTIVASYENDVEFEKEFAIYDLNKFLGVLNLFTNPELDFTNESYVKIGDDNVYVNYVFGDPAIVSPPPNKDINMPSSELEFVLTSVNLGKVLKASSVLGVSDISVIAENGKIFLQAYSKKDPTSDVYRIEVGESEVTGKVDFIRDNLSLLSNDYDVSISAKGFSKFVSKNPTCKVTYWISIEKSSKL